jgi:regulator of protease activity HflC (stomatin/prohibitin superfamily)
VQRQQDEAEAEAKRKVNLAAAEVKAQQMLAEAQKDAAFEAKLSISVHQGASLRQGDARQEAHRFVRRIKGRG